jgi:hypothetical protein
MGLARSTYYDEPEIQPIDEARLVEQIKEVCAEWPAYGYRRVTAATQRSDTKVLSSLKRNAPGRWPIERHHACPSQRVQSKRDSFSGPPRKQFGGGLPQNHP